MADSTPTSPVRVERSRAARRAFTLVELLVALSISGLVLAGVLAAAIQIMRSGVRVTQYAEMDTQVRRAFEQLAVDLKAASAFTYNAANDITVSVAESDGTTSLFTYAWNSTTKVFYRVAGADSAATSGRLQLMTGVSALTFSRLTTAGAAATTDNSTKRLGLAVSLVRSASGAARATATVANTYTLRNKPVS